MPLDEAEEPVGVGRWVMPVVPHRRQHPSVLLLRDQHETGGPARLGTDGDQLRAAQRPGEQAEVSGGVLHVDREPLLGRLVVADRRQPGRHPAAAPGGVEDQVGVHGLLGATAEAQDPHPGDAVPGRIGGQTDGLAPVDELDRRQRGDPSAEVAFQVGPAGLAADRLRGPAGEAEQVAARGEPELREVPDHRHAPGRQVVEQPRKELVEDLRPSGHQQVGVPALRDPPPTPGRRRERVAVDDRDPPVRVGQHPGSEQPGNAGPEDHRVVTDRKHLALPVGVV